MKTTILKNIFHSILAESDDIKSIFDFVSSKYKLVKITGTCNDGSQLETNDIQELLAFENLNFRKLETILFLAFTDDESEKFLFVIHDNQVHTAEIHLSSNDDEKALYIVQELLKRLLVMKPNYDWIARVPVLVAVMSLLMVIWFVVQGSIYTGIIHSAQATSINGVEYFNRSVFMAIVLLGLTYPLEKLKKYLFPKVFFLIGKQKKAMETIQKIRTFIFVTVTLSILLGFLTNWIYSVVF
jgi:hypothetical protein